jgi:hypothetical protein
MQAPITNRDLLLFTFGVSAVFLGITGVGYYYFCKWHQREKAEGRQHIDAHVAEVMRDVQKEDK